MLVVDNYGCPDTKRLVEAWVHGARYVIATEVRGTAAAKDQVFREAQGDAVLCCDSHVLFAADTIRRLKKCYREHPECPDLLQGPLVYDDLQTISTHFDPGWRARSWGPILGCYVLVPDSMSGSRVHAPRPARGVGVHPASAARAMLGSGSDAARVGGAVYRFAHYLMIG